MLSRGVFFLSGFQINWEIMKKGKSECNCHLKFSLKCRVFFCCKSLRILLHHSWSKGGGWANAHKTLYSLRVSLQKKQATQISSDSRLCVCVRICDALGGIRLLLKILSNYEKYIFLLIERVGLGCYSCQHRTGKKLVQIG